MMDWKKRVNGLVFDEDSTLDNHVYPVSRLDLPVAIPDWQCDFAFDSQPTFPKFKVQAGLVGGFEHPRPKFSMNPNATINNHRRDLINPISLDSIHFLVRGV